jgi:acetyl esterase/lipase
MVMKKIAVALCFALATPAVADDEASFRALAMAATSAPRPKITATYGADPIDNGELRIPPGKGPFPVAVLIHGGCWDAGTGGRDDMTPLAAALTKSGFATWNIEYRRVGDAGGGWPGTFRDVAAGVDYVRVLAKTQPLDLRRLVIVGHSSGAHLALWAASRRTLDASLAGKAPLSPAAVVAIDGPGTLAPFVGIDAQVCGHPAIVPLMGGTPAEKPAEYKLASPADRLPFGVRQLLVLGELGPMMEPYVAAAKASGDRVEALAPKDADHFNILNPGSTQGAEVVDFIAAKALPTK